MADETDQLLSTASSLSSLIPGVGTLLSAGLSIGKGVYDISEGKAKRNSAISQKPPFEDPEMRQYLGYLQRKRRAIETGSMYGRQANKIGQQLADTQSGIVQVSGGNAGAAISGMLQAQRGAGEAYGDLVEKNLPLGLQYEKAYGGVLDQISQRKADLQLLGYSQDMAESAALTKGGNESLYGGLEAGIGGATSTLSTLSSIAGKRKKRPQSPSYGLGNGTDTISGSSDNIT
jgi:hypothetical protein